MKYSKYNVVIIGSGLAGLYLANKLSENKNFSEGILLITKSQLFSGSTSVAQGGIVSVIPEINSGDSLESHIKDTIAAGCGLNNINTVKFVSENSAQVAQELIAMGVEFDKNKDNKLNFTLEGAHSVPAILHAGGDSTGQIIEKVLSDRILNSTNIDIYSDTMAIEILKDSNNVARGVIVYNTLNNSFEAIYSNTVVIATGGIGQIYLNTTNPLESTADGIALALNAGAQCDNMEFVQFHPTGLYCENKEVTPLISESVRGEGAKLVNINGEYFAKKYHKKADLAPRDVVARAILNEMKLTNAKYVNLDVSQIGIQNFKLRFPTITKLCLEHGIDLSSGLIPVTPVQHYFMGGIKTDINSKTSIENLYAIGECSMTGLHGANRLASNSLLECAVFAQSLYENIADKSLNPPKKQDETILKTISKYLNYNLTSDDSSLIDNLFIKLKTQMTNNVGIIRNKNGLNYTLNAIEDIESAVNANSNTLYKRKIELLNALTVSKEIVKSALRRDKSIGSHFRDDEIQNLNTETKNTEIGNINKDEILA